MVFHGQMCDKLLGETGEITNEGTRKFLQQFMQAFADWVKTNSKS